MTTVQPIANRTKSRVLIKFTPLILRTDQSLLLRPRTRIPLKKQSFGKSQREPLMPRDNFGSAFLRWQLRVLDDSAPWPSAIDSSTLEIVSTIG